MKGSRRLGSVGIAFLVVALGLGPAACAAGDTAPRATDRPTSDATLDAPSPDRSQTRDLPTASRDAADSPRPSRSAELDRSESAEELGTTAAAESVRPPAVASPERPIESAPAQSRPADVPPAESLPVASRSATVAAATEDSAVGPLVCVLVVVVALIVGGLLISRSQRRSAWDREAEQLRAETLAATESRLPPVLTTTAAADRILVWPPIRAGLVGLVGRWDALFGAAAGEQRQDWALRISRHLQDVLVAVDVETEAIRAGADWRVVRFRVLEAQQALVDALATDLESPAVTPGPAEW